MDDPRAGAREDDDPPVVEAEVVEGYHTAYVQLFGLAPTPSDLTVLDPFAGSMGDDVVAEALRRAKTNGARQPVRYAEKILMSWDRQGVRDLSGVEELDRRFEAGRQRGKNGARASPAEPRSWGAIRNVLAEYEREEAES